MFYNQTTDILGILTPIDDIDDIDTKKVSRKYYSLEKLDVPNESLYNGIKIANIYIGIFPNLFLVTSLRYNIQIWQ